MLITKKDIEHLSDIQFTNCISIYIPTHRAGFNNSRIDYLNFKNALGKARADMEELRFEPHEIHKLLQPAYELLDDESFWTRLSDGLAVFISANHFEYFELPIKFNSRVYVGQKYYLRPLLPMFTGNGRFFLLALSQNEVRFFEGGRYHITPVTIKDLVPESMEEALVLSDREMTLQAHSGSHQSQSMIYHGQGAGKDNQRIYLEKYFKQVDNGLMEMLHDEKAPLMLASVDHLAPIYRKVSSYTNLMDHHVKGNPEHYNPVQLHERAWPLMRSWFNQEQEKAKTQFLAQVPEDKSTVSTEAIVPAAIAGRVDTLFVNKDADTSWGFYDLANHQAIQHDKRQRHSSCLIERSAIKTFLQGGTVFHVKAEEMPYPNTVMNATFRY